MPRGVYIRTPETCRIISESKKGEKHPNFGKHLLETTKQKISQKRKLFLEDPIERSKLGDANRGKQKSAEICMRISESKKGDKHPNFGKHLNPSTKQKIRESHIALKGGLSFEPYCPKFNRDFKERVRAFFEYRCVECGSDQPEEKLSIHHVNFNKDSCCSPDAPRLFVALCRKCHAKTSFNRPYWEQHFTEIIMKKYDGKCYLSNDEVPT